MFIFNYFGDTKLFKFTTMASLTATTMASRTTKPLPIPSKSPTKSFHHHCPLFVSAKHHQSASQRRLCSRTIVRASSSGSSPGLYSAQKFELTPQNVDLVLEDVRPYLIADGGNVAVVSVEDGIVSLQLQGFLLLTNCIHFQYKVVDVNSWIRYH